jgi:hypothetical protein
MTKQKRLMPITEACLFVADMKERTLWFMPERTIGYPVEVKIDPDISDEWIIISTQEAFREWDAKCEDSGPVVYWP